MNSRRRVQEFKHILIHPVALDYPTVEEVRKALAEVDPQYLVVQVAKRTVKSEIGWGYDQEDVERTQTNWYITCSYYREETDEEFLDRLRQEEQVLKIKEEKDKLTYLTLKAKYEKLEE